MYQYVFEFISFYLKFINNIYLRVIIHRRNVWETNIDWNKLSALFLADMNAKIILHHTAYSKCWYIIIKLLYKNIPLPSKCVHLNGDCVMNNHIKHTCEL